MKKLVLLFGLIASCNANAGTAFIPKFLTTNSGTWCVSISNIGNIDASVTVNAYKSEGTLYTGASVNNDIPSQFNSPFTLKPNETTLLCVQNVSGSSEHGYAVIKGIAASGNTNDHSRLLASAYFSPSNKAYSRNIPVNGGLPF